MKPRQFARCIFLPYSHRENLPEGTVAYDLSSYADHPWCTFSPIWSHGGIPVPGMPGVTSDTVEGIWQGLKVIRGKTVPYLFKGRGQKRGGKKPSGHQYGKKLLGYMEARYKIYKVSYEWVLANRIDPEMIDGFIEQAFRGVPQYFHDLGNNGDIHNTNLTVAHSSFVVQYVNRLCTERAST